MFNEKNITQALTQLTNMYEMEHTMRQFGDIYFEDLYLPDVCMALMNRVQTVFQYEVNSEDSPCFQYRGGDLFGQRACKVFEELISSTNSLSVVNRFWELWLLEDMTFVVVENINMNMAHTKHDHYSTDYRNIKSVVQKYSDLPFDFAEILQELSTLEEEMNDSQAIIYAM